MSLLTGYELLVLNLAEKIPLERRAVYMPKERAHELLVQITGQDHGYDVESWRKWLTENGLLRPARGEAEQ
jgi:hypothetical protein